MEQGEELRHDALHLVGDEHLVAVELYLVALQVDVRLYLGEIQDAREVERIVHVEVNPEERFVLHGIESAVETLVVLVFQRARRLCPERLHVVDDVVLVGVHLFAVFPLRLLAESHGDWQELAVFVEERLDARLFEEFLAVVVDIQDDVRTAAVSLRLGDFKFRTSVAAPLHCLCAVFVALGDDFHLLAHHERAVETKSEVSDNGVGVVLVFVEKIVHAGEGYLVDIPVNLLLGHTDASVAYGQRTLLCVEAHMHSEVA